MSQFVILFFLCPATVICRHIHIIRKNIQMYTKKLKNQFFIKAYFELDGKHTSTKIFIELWKIKSSKMNTQMIIYQKKRQI